MKYIKNYTTKFQAVADENVVAPLLGYCAENNQTLLQWGGVIDKPLEIKQLQDGSLTVDEKPAVEFVDFGLPSGTLWYNKNIGATNGNTAESWYGKYLSWGELEEKTGWDGQGTKIPYDWANYKYANGTSNKLTKYCNDSTYGNEGYTDELTQLVPTDDVATVTNSAWRMPTKEDFEELLARTSSSWVENYNDIGGLNGRVFIKATIVSPSFKNITLYSPLPEGEVTDEMWAQISGFTLEEVNAMIGGQDIRTMMFKDAEMTILAEYGTDYGFVVKQTDPSISMFIPAAGYRNGSNINNVGSYCYLWSSSLYLDYPNLACILGFYSGNITMSSDSRYDGSSVRPVQSVA